MILLAVLLITGCTPSPDSGRDTTSEAIPQSTIRGPIALDKGAYGVPFDVNLSEVMQWSREHDLIVRLPVEEEHKSQILEMIDNIEAFQNYPNASDHIPSMEDTIDRWLALDNLLTKLIFKGGAFDREKQRLLALRIRDHINTLRNPYVVDDEGKHYLEPVFSLRQPITLFEIPVDETDVLFYETDDKIIRQTCRLSLFKARTSETQDPLDEISVYFIHTKGGWKSYACLVTFSRDLNSIIETLNEKYDNGTIIKRCFVTSPSPESVELVSVVKHLIGWDVSNVIGGSESADFLVWRKNVFAFGELTFLYSRIAPRRPLFLLYYDSKYEREILQCHYDAFEEKTKDDQKSLKQFSEKLKKNL
jgi:hypothetical protein